MRVAWSHESDKSIGDRWLANIGRCAIHLRRMDWHDAGAREHPLDRTWVYRVWHYAEDYTASDLDQGVFEVERDHYRGGLEQAQQRVIAIARAFVLCKRTRRKHEALDPESVAWLEERLLETLRVSYTRWRESIAHVKRLAAEGDRWAQQALWDLRKIYPEPKWSTAQLADEAAQYRRPDDLNVSDKRFYVIVRSALDRLKRRKLITSSAGLDTRGRGTTLWEPA